MSETITLELTKENKEIIMRGLRFVRSQIMLDINDQPTAAAEEERRAKLQQVAELTEHLTRSPVMAH